MIMSKREQKNAAARLKRRYARYEKRNMDRYGDVGFHEWAEHYLEHMETPFAQCYYGRLDENGKCKKDPWGWAWGKPPPPPERMTAGDRTLEHLGGTLWKEVEAK